MALNNLDIGDVASRSGVPASALRFYERRGLIASSGRNGLRRTYSSDVLLRLEMITCAKTAGFTLAQIARFIVSTPTDIQLRGQMALRAASLDEEIDRLQRMRASLRHAAVCTHAPLVECRRFKASFAPDATETPDGPCESA